MSYTSQADPMQAMVNAMTPKFAVSYLRVSTRGQAERGGGADEGFSIPAQREANKRKALSMGAMVGKEFVDRGASARSADRPELQKMLEYIKENADRVDYVIVHKVDRLARNRGDDIDIMRTLDECGVQLVSASESIDNTPSGMLLHGIMSAIAEFYSQNLATEVKKGMSQKVKNGGTPTKAPIGYRNIRAYDDKGRRDSRVELDEQRAPLLTLAFEKYATGDWTLSSLAEHLTDLGLDTPATPRRPSRPITKKQLHNILLNPYYKGIVTYNGVQYEGKQPLIIDPGTWEKVQGVLKSHVNGERSRIHEHYLKSTVYCGHCGSRLIIHNAKSHTGTRYPYFVCIGRHDKKTNCTQKAVLIEEVEARIEQLYEKISFTAEFTAFMQKYVDTQIDKLAETFKEEQKRLKLEKDKLERKQHKLLQAHYEDAIPLSLLKEEQREISKTLTNINERMKAYDIGLDDAKENLRYVFELLDDCGKVYKFADEQEKRLLNQALFKRILVYDDLSLSAEFNAPFDTVISPSAQYLGANNKGNDPVSNQESLFTQVLRSQLAEKEAESVKQKEQHGMAALFDETSQNAHFFDEGLSKDNLLQSGEKRSEQSGLQNPTAHPIKTTQTTNFFSAGLSMDILVRKMGLEPTRHCCHKILSLARLPVPTLPHFLPPV